MSKNRLEAFSDGVIAILITIMVLELTPPHEASWAGLQAVLPTLFSYTLSFTFLGIYWNNHHHLLQAVKQVDGRVLWANLHLLFWLSLISFGTAWMGESGFAPLPVALYGLILLLSAIAYYILVRTLLVVRGNAMLATAIGSDFKGKISIVFYVVAVGLAFVSTGLACALYVLVALIWLVPDARIEKNLSQ